MTNSVRGRTGVRPLGPRGVCSVCAVSQKLRRDGTVGAHKTYSWSDRVCPGVGEMPQLVTRERESVVRTRSSRAPAPDTTIRMGDFVRIVEGDTGDHDEYTRPNIGKVGKVDSSPAGHIRVDISGGGSWYYQPSTVVKLDVVTPLVVGDRVRLNMALPEVRLRVRGSLTSEAQADVLTLPFVVQGTNNRNGSYTVRSYPHSQMLVDIPRYYMVRELESDVSPAIVSVAEVAEGRPGSGGHLFGTRLTSNAGYSYRVVNAPVRGEANWDVVQERPSDVWVVADTAWNGGNFLNSSRSHAGADYFSPSQPTRTPVTVAHPAAPAPIAPSDIEEKVRESVKHDIVRAAREKAREFGLCSDFQRVVDAIGLRDYGVEMKTVVATVTFSISQGRYDDWVVDPSDGRMTLLQLNRAEAQYDDVTITEVEVR